MFGGAHKARNTENKQQRRTWRARYATYPSESATTRRSTRPDASRLVRSLLTATPAAAPRTTIPARATHLETYARAFFSTPFPPPHRAPLDLLLRPFLSVCGQSYATLRSTRSLTLTLFCTFLLSWVFLILSCLFQSAKFF